LASINIQCSKMTLRPKDCDWGSAPDPTTPNHLAGFKGVASRRDRKEEKMKERKLREKYKGMRKVGKTVWLSCARRQTSCIGPRLAIDEHKFLLKIYIRDSSK